MIAMVVRQRRLFRRRSAASAVAAVAAALAPSSSSVGFLRARSVGAFVPRPPPSSPFRPYTTTTTRAAGPHHVVLPPPSQSFPSSRRAASGLLAAATDGGGNPSTDLIFDPTVDLRSVASATLVVGRRSSLQTLIYDRTDHYVSLFGFRPEPQILRAAHASLDGTGGASSSLCAVPTVGPAEPRPPHRVSLLGLRDGVTRNNHPMSLHAVTDLVRGSCPAKGIGLSDIIDGGRDGNGNVLECGGDDKGPLVVRIVAVAESPRHVGPMALAIARAFPLFDRKTRNGKKGGSDGRARVVHVTFLDADGKVIKDDSSLQSAEAAAEGVRLACRLVDTHPEELTTTAFAEECRALFQDEESVTVEEIVGEELRDGGYGGLYNVGKAAVHPPRLVIMTYVPPVEPAIADASDGERTGDDDGVNDVESPASSSPRSIALVGKGIVYDTGGLAIKSRVGMCGMKHDMGGAAGLLGGFAAAVRLKPPRTTVRLVLCLAENAIGPTAVRNDDILDMYSGKTVEINNSDAEGRVVLADGVAHVARHYKDVDLLVDMATLTGAQLISTGKMHAGILANTEELEQRAVRAGLRSGDLCYPLLYAPELLKKEFNSKVADMKNSVKDRSNAQCSCAGHFIESHLGTYKGDWLHVDMAGPGTKNERGTGYGVGLTMALVKARGFD